MLKREFVLKIGERARFYFNVQDGTIVISELSGIEVYYVKEDQWEPLAIGIPVKVPLPYEGLMSFIAAEHGMGIARIEHRDSEGNVKETLLINAAIIRLSLMVDANRNGTVEEAETGVANWVWGHDQRGAVCLVNNDRDISELQSDSDEQSELASIVILSTLVDKLPDGYRLVLMSTEQAARRFSIYRRKNNGSLKRILGCDPKVMDFIPITQSSPLDLSGEHCFIEAHEFPGPFFEGLITVKLGLIDDSGIEISEVSAVFRVAPWIMTPNTLLVEEVYACKIVAAGKDLFGIDAEFENDLSSGFIPDKLKDRFNDEGFTITEHALVNKQSDNKWIITDGEKSYIIEKNDENLIIFAGEDQNKHFLSDLKKALTEIDIPLQVIPPTGNLGDRWIQDEIEFGYCQGTTHTIPVVFDSPRDRGLDDFPEKKLLGPDFGHFQIGGSTPNSLDSFGNLDICPPTEVNGKRYPLGRIVFGGRELGDYSPYSRQMMPQIRRFLYSQKVQSPVEIFSDWLSVGHVDEIICFVPANNSKGFQMLIASPIRAEVILKRLNNSGYGNTIMFKDMRRGSPHSPISAEISIAALLSDTGFWKVNERYQKYLDMNNNILQKELGISDAEIIQIPVLFQKPGQDGRTAAYFPDMVNHLVIGNLSLVPKPHGPIIDGECAFERAFKDALPNRDVRFIEDWYSYHEAMGEVHCGTNARRKPFDNINWWGTKPDGGYDI